MAFTPEQMREYRKRLKQEHTCTSCHKACNLDRSKASCGGCISRINAARKIRRARFREEGRCGECGIMQPGAKGDGWYCPGCKEDYTAYRHYGTMLHGRNPNFPGVTSQ